MTQGQGKHTAAKIAGFEAALRQNVAIVAKGIRAQHYFHFDMNAGSGWNDRASCYGSPLAFRAAACSAGFPSAMSFCCELDPAAAKQLAERTKVDPYTYVVCGRNQKFAEMIPRIISRFGVDPSEAFGSILLDPNDQCRDAIPYEELRHATAACPRLDVFFNFPQLAMKRIVAAVQKGKHPASSARDCFHIDDMPQVMGRNHLWIKQTPDMGNFALVVGRNTDNVSADRQTGLAAWDSDNGILYRERCVLPVDVANARHAERMAKKSGQSLLFA
jgi:hypothetical protein